MLRTSHTSTGNRLEAADGSPVVTSVLPREPESVPAARRLVRHTLADWRLSNLADTAELVVAELSANAVEHARHASFRVTLKRGPGDRVRVAVTDKSTALPVLRALDEEDEGGRGLALVAALSCQWGTDPLNWGKRVWADLEPEQPQENEPADAVPIYPSHWAQVLYVLVVVVLAAAIGLGVASGPP
ncbi:ATP-binding protein [Streptomyces shenzhenensis]|uniref:ATP-binding protein n=1 Tax=Streptomyces shenzhenensis TaxID=943815 RepID=UPI0015EFDD37|nr:ATP-binding protein [Streptomyces shenzhenensis]